MRALNHLSKTQRVVIGTTLGALAVVGYVGSQWFNTTEKQASTPSIERPSVAPIEESNRQLSEAQSLISDMREQARTVTVG